ncbi:hypothetical protein DL93DRAFT_114393 [Clavulina sp. PMI_390]|nr:hypothetical protein DL93DRAFT_114393 [Clavulina sp. PMI_390]
MSTDSQSAMDQPSTSSGDLAGLASQFVGPMIIGTFFSFMLNGVLLMQTHGYWRRFRETDATWIVGLVAFTVSIALASGGIAGYLSYYYGVLHFGDVEEMFHEINQFSVLVVCISTCSAPVQFFFGWRVKRLTGQRWLLWLAIAAGIVEITCGIGTVVYGTPLHDFRKFAQLRGWVIAWDGTASITDLIITVVLVNHLRKNRTGIRSTDDMLRRIERLTIQTGLITAVAASVALGLFSGINNNVSFAVNAALPPL